MAQEADQAHVETLRQARRAGRRGRHRGKRGETAGCGLLHHFETGAAGDDQGAVTRGDALARQCAERLVQGIVAADILAHMADRPVAADPAGGVGGPGGLLQRLQGRQPAHALMQRRQRKRLLWRQRRQFARYLVQALGPAQSAAGTSGQAAAMRLEAGEVGAGNLDLQRDAGRRLGDDQVENVLPPRTMPSDRLKPTPKSSRSAGVASITAWLMPLYSKATGVSSARSSGRLAPSRQTSWRASGFMRRPPVTPAPP
jgi:hypothetical protein